MFTFNHSGKIGDLLYSLYFCKALAKFVGDEKFNFHIQTNVLLTLEGRLKNIPRLDDEKASYIASILKNQEYINELTISPEFNIKDYLKGINLDNFRNLKINFSSSIITLWYFNLAAFHLERHFDLLLIKVEPNNMFKNKILLFQTKKYINPFVNLNVLKPYEDKILFVGMDEEYELIRKKYNFNIFFYKAFNGLEMAQAIKGASLIISNQNGNFAIAELTKANRILIPAQFELVGKDKKKIENGPTNVLCYGGWYDYANSTIKLKNLLQLIFK